MTIERNRNAIGNYLVTQIDELWDQSPLSVASEEVDAYRTSCQPGDQAKHAFDAMKKLMGASLVSDGLCVGVLENWQKLERVLYATDEQYRDHFLHPFNTYLLGLIVGKHMDMLNCDNLDAWQYAAFFHDVGYPVEKAQAISTAIRETYFRGIPQFTVSDMKVGSPQPGLLSESHDCISQIAGHYVGAFGQGHKSGQPNAEAIFQEGLLLNDHGVVSAVIFWNFAFLDALLGGRDNTLELVQKSVTAMAVHNLHRTFRGLRIPQAKLPLSFLLSLCDELQEWGRPSVAEMFRGVNIQDSPDSDGWRAVSELKIEKQDGCLRICFGQPSGCNGRIKRFFDNLYHLFKEVLLPGTDGIQKFVISVGEKEFEAKKDGDQYVAMNPCR